VEHILNIGNFILLKPILEGLVNLTRRWSTVNWLSFWFITQAMAWYWCDLPP